MIYDICIILYQVNQNQIISIFIFHNLCSTHSCQGMPDVLMVLFALSTRKRCSKSWPVFSWATNSLNHSSKLSSQGLKASIALHVFGVRQKGATLWLQHPGWRCQEICSSFWDILGATRSFGNWKTLTLELQLHPCIS